MPLHEKLTEKKKKLAKQPGIDARCGKQSKKGWGHFLGHWRQLQISRNREGGTCTMGAFARDFTVKKLFKTYNGCTYIPALFRKHFPLVGPELHRVEVTLQHTQAVSRLSMYTCIVSQT